MKLRPYIGWIVGYLVLIALIVWGFQQAYNWGTGAFSSTTEKKNWQEWRKTVVKQNKEQGPVERRVPKSEEPPLLVLMRDHYSTCLVDAGKPLINVNQGYLSNGSSGIYGGVKYRRLQLQANRNRRMGISFGHLPATG